MIEQKLSDDQLEVISRRSKNDQRLPVKKWMEDSKRRNTLVAESLRELEDAQYFSDLAEQRRELISEKNVSDIHHQIGIFHIQLQNLMLSLLHLVTRYDIDMRNLFSDYRLNKVRRIFRYFISVCLLQVSCERVRPRCG